METTNSEADLRRLAKKRAQARIGLGIHVAMYLAVNASLVAMWIVSGNAYPWFLWPMLGWGIGVLGHLAAYFYGPDSPGEQRAITRELHRLQAGTHG
jgi:2TM domain-containing protein